MKPILLKSGKTVALEVPVRGIPPPEYIWTIADKVVVTDEQITVDGTTPNVAKLNVLDAQRKRSGIMKLKATNEHGSDEFELEYTVLGSPSKPNVKKRVDLVPADAKGLNKGKRGGKDGDKENDYPSLRTVPRGGGDGDDDDDGSGKGKGKKKKPRSDLPIGVGNNSPLAALVNWEAPEDDGGVPLQKYIIEARPEKGGKWEKCAEASPEETSAMIKNLKPDEKYKFRVRAVNKNDEAGEPSETDVCYVPPNVKAPEEAGKPEIVDFDEKKVVLKFKPPRNDGGAPITHYIVEAKDKNSPSGGWKEVAVTDSPDPTAVVDGLKEGQTLQFRIRAVNDAGVGEPGEASEAHLVRAKNSPPMIIRDTLKKDIKVDLGASLRIDLEYKGEPEPTVEFYLKPRKKKGKPEAPMETEFGNKFTVAGNWHRNEPAADALQYTGYFVIDKMERTFGGELTIVIKNENGEDSAKIPMKILGVPKSPRGPLEAVDVTKDSCVLKFKAPEDDGDCAPTSYIVEKMDTKTGLWVPCGRIDAPTGGDPDDDIKFQVKGLEEGQRYQFRVKACNDEGASEPLTTDSSILIKDPFSATTPPGLPSVVDFDGPNVDLEFTPPMRENGAPVQSYIVEKRVKGDTKWEKCAEVPSQGSGPQKAKVKGLTEGLQYQFRVKAVNKGGISDPSEESLWHLAKQKNGEFIFFKFIKFSFFRFDSNLLL